MYPSTSFFPQVLIKTAESKSGFRLQLLYYARSVAKHCDWNQAPGCQRETPQIEGKPQQIEEKSSFRFNCLTLSRQAKTIPHQIRIHARAHTYRVTTLRINVCAYRPLIRRQIEVIQTNILSDKHN